MEVSADHCSIKRFYLEVSLELILRPFCGPDQSFDFNKKTQVRGPHPGGTIGWKYLTCRDINHREDWAGHWERMMGCSCVSQPVYAEIDQQDQINRLVYLQSGSFLICFCSCAVENPF